MIYENHSGIGHSIFAGGDTLRIHDNGQFVISSGIKAQFVRKWAGITNWRELNKPKYNDFWSQNIDIKQLVAEEGMFKGQKYRYVVLRKTVLYPQKSGKLAIEPLSLDIDVQLPTNRRDMFGRVIVTDGSKRVSAGSKIITAKALPEAGKPEDFSGAVGNFDFKVTPTKTDLKNGESLDLVVSVTGKGNLKLYLFF